MQLPRKLLAILLVATQGIALGQWLNHADPRTPRTRDGKSDLGATPPRRNGKPDLSGVWEAARAEQTESERAASKIQIDLVDISTPLRSVFWGLKREEEPLTPAALAVMAQRRDPADFPPVRCLPHAVPADLFLYAFKIVQTPEEIVMLTEAGDPPREIFTDGRRLPKDPDPTWMGSSIGNWQGDTLVAETTGFKEAAWLDGSGHPRSEAMRITERYHRNTFGQMDLNISFEDPKYYTRPFAVRTSLKLLPDTNILEFVCAENERDLIHMQKH
jgi:hypothetical protein